MSSTALNKYIITVLLLCVAFLLKAQKVGVVMSGGAAKGIAHIGVLKALEENNIPIDYVVGTSMGAVVGSLYAAGYSPEEIERIAMNPAFEDWVNGSSTERYQYNYTKSQDNASWLAVDLLFNENFKASINTPLANDLIINFILNEYLGQAAQKANYDFDNLFVPFKAVAAEIFSEKVVRLDSGSLMQATRSSMAVPFFYRPIKFMNQYIFDGGLYDNFPVDIMKEDFNPDITIGVNVATKKADEYPFDADEKILTDALLFMFLDKTDPGTLGEEDIYIEPDMKPFTALDFDKVPLLIKTGYEATLAQMDAIKKKIPRSADKQQVEIKRNTFKAGFKMWNFGALELHGFEPKQEEYIRSLISFDEELLNLAQIRHAYFQLVSEPYFKNVYLTFSYNYQKQYFVLEFYLKPTAKRALSVDFGGNLSTRSVSTLQLGLNFNNFSRYLNTYKLRLSTGRFYESVHMAARFNLNPKSRLFLEPSFLLNQWNYLDTDDFFDDSFDPTVLTQTDRKLGATLGLGTGQRSVITAEAAVMANSDRFSNNKQISSNESLDVMRFRAFKSKLSFERNSLDTKQFPTSGVRFYSTANFFLGETIYNPGSTSALYRPGVIEKYNDKRDWFSLEFHFEEYKSLSENYTFGWMMESVYSTQPEFSNYQSTLVYTRQFNPMFDSETYFLPKYRAFSYLGAGMVHLLRLARSFFLRTELYAFSPYQRPEEGADQAVAMVKGFDRVQFLGMIATIYNTVLGPVTFRLNYLEDPKARVGVSLSFGYMIFGQRSLH